MIPLLNVYLLLLKGKKDMIKFINSILRHQEFQDFLVNPFVILFHLRAYLDVNKICLFSHAI